MGAHLEVWRPGGAELVPLTGEHATVGRDETNDVAFPEDQRVSRLHAVLQRYGGSWCVRDVGSANGTWVNGEQLMGERRLASGDEVRVGESRLVFRGEPARGARTAGAAQPPVLTRREKDVLVALCRSLATGGAFAQPATVRQLADQLVVSEAAVKFHLTNLYDKFGIYEGAGNRRVELANEALRRRAVTLAELRPAD